MAGAKEIRTKISSVQSTQKITRAMEMVAASKMRAAQNRMNAARPYAYKIRDVIGHLAQAEIKLTHPFLEEREINKIGYIVVSSDRGLCGGLNNNLFKAVVKDMQVTETEGKEVNICTIGTKAATFFASINANIVSQTTQMGDTPTVEQLIGIVKVMLDQYRNGEIDKLVICYNRFENTMTQAPTLETILPLVEDEEELRTYPWEYEYEPSAEEVLEYLLIRYIESLIYQCVVENAACEQSARMIAMKSASDNAGDIINELQLIYNKARQAAITQEIAEIVGGAAAV
mgnify:CR=1 FL=1